MIKTGGVVNLSFGGNLMDQTVPRQHVQQACKDVDELAELIKNATTHFRTKNIEFDIEVFYLFDNVRIWIKVLLGSSAIDRYWCSDQAIQSARQGSEGYSWCVAV